MINNLIHAREIQERRYLKGLRGYAKAVRRFMSKNLGDSYKAVKNELPVKF